MLFDDNIILTEVIFKHSEFVFFIDFMVSTRILWDWKCSAVSMESGVVTQQAYIRFLHFFCFGRL